MHPLYFPVFIGTLYNFSKYSYLALLPLYFSTLGLSDVRISFIMSSFPILIILLSGMLGKLSDGIGRMSIIRLGIIAELVGLLLYLFIPNFWAFLIARMCNSVAFVALGVVTFSQSEDLIDDSNRLKLTGVVMSFQQGASAVGPLVGGILGSIMLFLPFYVALGLTAVMYIATAVHMKHTSEPRQPVSLHKKDFAFWRSMIILWKHDSSRHLLFPAVGLNFAMPLVFVFFPLFVLSRFHVGVTELALLQFTIWSCYSFQFFFGTYIQKMGRSNELVVFMPLLIMLIFFLLPLVSSFPMFLGLSLCYSFCSAIWSVSSNGALSEIGEKLHMEGELMGTYCALTQMAQFVGSVLASFLLLFLDMSWIFFILGSVIVFSTFHGKKALCALNPL